MSTPVFARVAFAFTILFVFLVALSTCVYYSYVPEVDFIAFWAAGRLVVGGHPALAYDIQAHRAVEETVTHMGGLLPFPYPPPFLFVVSILGLLPYWLGYLSWILASSGLYLTATRRLMPARFAFAHPAAMVNAIIGQNGFLTSGIFLSGISAIATRPFTGGLILGLLIIKPQLAVLVPVALLAARQWRAIGGAVLSSLALLSLAALVFGLDSYRAFFAISHQFVAFMSGNRWNWGQQASVLGFFHDLGVPQAVGIAAQIFAAIVAAILTWRAWARGSHNRAAILMAATLLVPPYVFTYDSLLLVLPLAQLLKDGDKLWRPVVIWVCLAMPLLGDFVPGPGVNTIPIAAILSLWWLTEAGRESVRGPRLRPAAIA